MKHLCSIVLVSAFLLSSCVSAAFLDPATRNIFLREDVNLIERNYAAADYLAGYTHSTIGKFTPIYIGQLSHANQSNLSSAFGALVPKQVGSRMAQLGYNVIETSAVKEQQAVSNSGIVLAGDYFPSSQNVEIYLRLTDHKSGQILGSFDYSLPINDGIAELLEPEPTVFRMPKP